MMPPASVFLAASASWYTGLVSPIERANIMMCDASTGNVILAKGVLRFLPPSGEVSKGGVEQA